MDARRLLTASACALALAGCSAVGRLLPDWAGPAPALRVGVTAPAAVVPAASPRSSFAMEPIPDPTQRRRREPAGPAPALPGQADPAPVAAAPSSRAPATPPPQRRPTATEPPVAGPAVAEVTPAVAAERSRQPARAVPSPRRGGASGRAAIAEANARARDSSRADAFENGVQVFGFEPGRLFEVWTAPYRVTMLTLAPGETVTSKAAGDTVRWQIGETTSGSGAGQLTHVLVKPLERGLETNLVLTTSRRVYMVQLRSGADDAFNAAVAWRHAEEAAPPLPTAEPAAASRTVRLDPAALDGRYRVEARTGLGGRRPRWTPTAVFSDGARTVIIFPPDLHVDEAPVLFVLAPDGEAQVVNYRQQGGVFIVDRVFDRAELRLGERRPQVVRITRLPERRAAR